MAKLAKQDAYFAEDGMDGHMMFPLIISVLVSYGMARLTKAQSMYHDSLAFGPRSTFDKPLAQVEAQDVARKDPPWSTRWINSARLPPCSSRTRRSPSSSHLPAGKYLGSVVAEDVAAFARNKELAQAVLAMDVFAGDMPTLPADMHLPEALGIFSRPHCSESLALVNPNNDPSAGSGQQDGPLPGALRNHAAGKGAIGEAFSRPRPGSGKTRGKRTRPQGLLKYTDKGNPLR